MTVHKAVNMALVASLVLCFGVGFGAGDAHLASVWFLCCMVVTFTVLGIGVYIRSAITEDDRLKELKRKGVENNAQRNSARS